MAKVSPIKDKYKEGKYIRMRLVNVEGHWAHLQKPDTAFGDSKYSIDLYMDDALGDALRAEGFNVKPKVTSDGTVATKNHLKPKSSAIDKKTGGMNKPPEVVGPDGKPFTEPIGNGSILNVTIDARAWPKVGKPSEWTLSAYLVKVEVVKHIPYTGGVQDFGSSSVPF